MNTLREQLRALQERTEVDARKLSPQEARQLRAQSLARARELVEQDSAPALRLVTRAPMPSPGETGRLKAERRRR